MTIKSFDCYYEQIIQLIAKYQGPSSPRLVSFEILRATSTLDQPHLGPTPLLMGLVQLRPWLQSCSTYVVLVCILSRLSSGSDSFLCLVLTGLLVGLAIVSIWLCQPCSATLRYRCVVLGTNHLCWDHLWLLARGLPMEQPCSCCSLTEMFYLPLDPCSYLRYSIRHTDHLCPSIAVAGGKMRQVLVSQLAPDMETFDLIRICDVFPKFALRLITVVIECLL